MRYKGCFTLLRILERTKFRQAISGGKLGPFRAQIFLGAVESRGVAITLQKFGRGGGESSCSRGLAGGFVHLKWISSGIKDKDSGGNRKG